MRPKSVRGAGVGEAMPRSRLLSPTIPVLATCLALGCSCGATTSPPATPPAPPPAPTYEVHEWGLVRGTMDDRVMLSGPHAERIMVVAKPVLYFHRHGEGALVVDVEARIVSGRIVEHWPSPGGAAGTLAAWRGVVIQDGSCHGSRYPTLADDPCRTLSDGCEASTLASVETTDSSCLSWPPPPDRDGPTESWNHLFYRGEVTGAPSLPLRAEALPDGTVRLTSTGTAPIPGRILRVRRANGVAGATDGLSISAPPAPGASVIVAAPTEPLTAGGESLGASLREAGLTSDEIDAFRRAWDDTLFGHDVTVSATITSGTTAVVTATPMPIAPTVTTGILYVLPEPAADALATLTFSPPPTAVRRAIVVWIDEAHMP
jgi:hypothetical protein